MQREEIYSRIDRTGGPGSCWPWMGARIPSPGRDYGMVRYEGKLWRVHRLIWTLEFGEIPEGLGVLHSCDNPPCSNWPDHLFLGTVKDNYDDMVAKGRKWDGRRRMPSGDDHWMRRNPDRVVRDSEGNFKRGT